MKERSGKALRDTLLSSSALELLAIVPHIEVSWKRTGVPEKEYIANRSPVLCGVQVRESDKLSALVDLDDELTGERVLLLDAIKRGDMDTIRALTRIDWNFVDVSVSL